LVAVVYESQQENPRDHFQVTASQLEKVSEAHWRSDIIAALVFRVRPTTLRIADFGFRNPNSQPKPLSSQEREIRIPHSEI
jgi:hypothetical protein